MEWRIIELAKDIPFLCKINVVARKPPLTIELEYSTGDDLNFLGAFKN